MSLFAFLGNEYKSLVIGSILLCLIRGAVCERFSIASQVSFSLPLCGRGVCVY
jgi:hypothetical protein